jgi:hypothetical protein
MTRVPDFDELVGEDVGRGEQERLRRVHDLLIKAGPPAELSPELESGPTLAMTLGRAPRTRRRSVALLAAALALVTAAFLAGYVTGHGNDASVSSRYTLALVGTKAAPGAFASLRLESVDPAGNWPMRLSVTGLPKLPPRGYYTVYLMRNGKPYAPCGAFVVDGKAHGTSISLNAPYDVRDGDSWVVTKQMPGHHEAGPVVLQPRA